MKRKPLKKMRDLIEMVNRGEATQAQLEEVVKGKKTKLYEKAFKQLAKWGVQ